MAPVGDSSDLHTEKKIVTIVDMGWEDRELGRMGPEGPGNE